MDREDLIVAAEELKEKKNIDQVLSNSFTPRNLEGFVKILKQKGEYFYKERLFYFTH